MSVAVEGGVVLVEGDCGVAGCAALAKDLRVGVSEPLWRRRFLGYLHLP